MERYSSRTIDEVGRIVIHSELRQKLTLETGSKVYLQLVGTILIMQRAEGDTEPGCNLCEVNELGMVTLPAELRQKLNWKEKDRVALYNTDDLIILKLA